MPRQDETTRRILKGWPKKREQPGRFASGYFSPGDGITTKEHIVILEDAVVTGVLNVDGIRKQVLVIGGILVTASRRLLTSRGLPCISKGMRVTGKLYGLEEMNDKVLLPFHTDCAIRVFNKNAAILPIDLHYHEFADIKKKCRPALVFYRWCEQLG